MAFALGTKEIYCPNCKYVGPSRIKGSTGGEWVLLLVAIIAAVFVPILWGLVLIFILVMMFKPARHVCRQCKFENTAPASTAPKEEEAAQAVAAGETKTCPACAEDIKLEAKKCRYCGEVLDVTGSGSVDVK